MEGDLSVDILEKTMPIKNIFTAKTNCGRLVAVKFTNLWIQLTTADPCTCTSKPTIVVPGLSWYIKHSLINGSKRRRVKQMYPTSNVDANLRSSIFQRMSDKLNLKDIL